MIRGLSHITLLVSDLARTAAMLETVLDAQRVYDSGPRQFSLSAEMFFRIGGVWVCIMQGEPPAAPGYAHIAFKIDEADLDACRARILAAGLTLRPGRPRVSGEGESLYFYDFDNHLFELHTGTLEARLARYAQPEST